MIPLSWYFSIGLFGVLARKNAIAILMGVELMLNAVNINLIAFWRYITPTEVTGLMFGAMVFVVAAAEVAVGLALVISVWRRFDNVSADELDLLKR